MAYILSKTAEKGCESIYFGKLIFFYIILHNKGREGVDVRFSMFIMNFGASIGLVVFCGEIQ